MSTDLKRPPQPSSLAAELAASPLDPAEGTRLSAPHAATHHFPRLDRPTTTRRPTHVFWQYVVGIGGIHLLALLAFLPYCFSWTGVVLALAGLYCYGTLGINLCYHRLLTHQGFKVPKTLEHVFATLGVCCLQDTPARWVAIHRLHHQFSDHVEDPHSPLVNFLWGHMGWLVVQNREHNKLGTYEKYARDVLRDPLYFRFERGLNWAWIYGAHALVYYLLGAALGYLTGGTWQAALQFGLSLLVWGVFVRTVLVWHITWSVNSLTHLFGYRNYETNENSRNNWFVALVSNGEGWHNNHHADQRAAAHGHRWWEFDVTWLTIRALEALGLASDVVPPRCWNKRRTGQAST